MNTMQRRLSVVEAQGLLKQLHAMYGNELNVRVTVELSGEKIGDVIPALKSRGFRAHPESSSYAEREIVITSKVEDRPDGHP